jgi:coatomer subunit beta
MDKLPFLRFIFREVVERNAPLRQKIIEGLTECFPLITTGKVLRGALWIIGEYSVDSVSVENAFSAIRKSLGELPILACEEVISTFVSGCHSFREMH